jgi:hypothetical protein
MRSAGARGGLLVRIGGQHAERDRDVVIECDLLEPACGLAGDVVEVRSFAANHAAQRNDPVIMLRQALGGERQFECAGDVKHVETGGVCAGQSVFRALQKLGRDVAVEARDDDREAQPGRI